MIPDGCPTAFGCHGHHVCPCHCPSRVAYIVLYMLYTLYGAASRFSNISSRIEVGFPVHSPGKDSWLQDSVALELFQAKKPNMKNYSPKLTKQKIQSNNIKLYVYIYIHTLFYFFQVQVVVVFFCEVWGHGLGSAVTYRGPGQWMVIAPSMASERSRRQTSSSSGEFGQRSNT